MYCIRTILYTYVYHQISDNPCNCWKRVIFISIKMIGLRVTCCIFSLWIDTILNAHLFLQMLNKRTEGNVERTNFWFINYVRIGRLLF